MDPRTEAQLTAHHYPVRRWWTWRHRCRCGVKRCPDAQEARRASGVEA